LLHQKGLSLDGQSLTPHSEVRIVASSKVNLEQSALEGRFPENLLYRLNVIEVHVQPLRERPEDILPLARPLLAFFGRVARRSPMTLSKDAESIIYPPALPLARQHPRTAQHDGTCRDPVSGPDD